ncbi:hypothetical protein WJX64_00330 [Leifsonia sp. YIM 134122]|uniref:Secreted protein n=1 Tax=Leifsonia stereocauli TaxID=3134136 RepID=A0ABU9VZ16_9MICO
MGKSMGLLAASAASLFAVVTLSGCVDPGTSFAVFDREAVSTDAFPSDLPDYADDELVPASSRFVGEYDGDTLYLAQGKKGEICLLIDPEDSVDWSLGCGGGTSINAGGPRGEYFVRPDSGTPPEGSVRISDNVYAAE